MREPGKMRMFFARGGVFQAHLRKQGALHQESTASEERQKYFARISMPRSDSDNQNENILPRTISTTLILLGTQY